MIRFDKPINLNGSELISQLQAAGVEIPIINNEPSWPIDDMSGSIWLDINEADKDKAEQVIAVHNGSV